MLEREPLLIDGRALLTWASARRVASVAAALKGMAKRASRRPLDRRARPGGTVDGSQRNRIASRSPESLAVWRQTIRHVSHHSGCATTRVKVSRSWWWGESLMDPDGKRPMVGRDHDGSVGTKARVFPFWSRFEHYA
jgi:hypothetical protein